MNSETRKLLARWKSLENEGGVERIATAARILWFVGLALFLFVVFAVVYRLHPVLIATGAAAVGWVTAESNALRLRLAQWPIFKNYIDWKRVDEDLNE